MRERMESDIWEGLATNYLTKNETWNYLQDKEARRKEFVNLIKQRLFKDIWCKMEKSGETKNPFIVSKNSEFIRNDRRTKILVDKRTEEASIENKGAHFILKINEDIYNNKKSYKSRSCIAHELGHTFLYDTDLTPIKPYFEYPGGSLFFQSKTREDIFRKEEGFVYEIALHILVPDEYLRKKVSLLPSIEEFIKACEEFKVTREMMVKRLYWYTYNWSTGDNYWSDSAFYFYPYFGENSFIRHPKGNSEVFRGVLFKKERLFEIKVYWYKMINLIIDALDKPEKIISKQLELEKKNIKGEAIYLPNENRFLIMVKPLIEDV